MSTTNQEHIKTLIGSLNKAFKEAKRKGTYSVRDLYFLNCIQKTINFACEIKMKEEEIRELTKFYYAVLRSSNKFCVQEFETDIYKNVANSTYKTFVQTGETPDVSSPTVQNNSIII